MSNPIYAAAAAALRPDPRLTVTEHSRTRWMPETNREGGNYRPERTPFWIEPMDNLSVDSPVWWMVIQKGAQTGGTTFLENWLRYIIDHAPNPTLYILPTKGLARDESKERIQPMIRYDPRLREKVKEPRTKDADSTILQKYFPGGFLFMMGANSAPDLRRVSICNLLCDDLDGWEKEVGGEGDPFALALRRTNTFEGLRKIVLVSTPTAEGKSRIAREYEATDRRRYHVPCPSCGHLQTIEWGRLAQPGGKRWSSSHPPRSVVLICEACACEIEEHHKVKMLAAGKWIPQLEAPPGVRGYHLSGLYAPLGWFSWATAAAEHLAAKKAGVEMMRGWTNTVLAETYKDSADSASWEALMTHRRNYPAPVPAGGLALYAGVDIQKNRIEAEVVAFGEGFESWSVAVGIFYGDPAREEDDCWRQLQAFLSQSFRHESGVEFDIVAACVDANYLGDLVRQFCRPLASRSIVPVVGRAGHRPLIVPQKLKMGRVRVRQYILGVDVIKSILYSHFKVTSPGPGYCHFPASEEYDEEFFRQLTGERLLIRNRLGQEIGRWEKVHPRVEALDRRVYAYAATRLRPPVWQDIKAALAGTSSAPPDPQKRPMPKSNWVNRWRR